MPTKMNDQKLGSTQDVNGCEAFGVRQGKCQQKEKKRYTGESRVTRNSDIVCPWVIIQGSRFTSNPILEYAACGDPFSSQLVNCSNWLVDQFVDQKFTDTISLSINSGPQKKDVNYIFELKCFTL